MTVKYLPVYALALAIAFVGALWAGMSTGTLLLLAAVLACPLMMFFMMRGMHGDSGQHGTSDREASHRGTSDPEQHELRDRHTPSGV